MLNLKVPLIINHVLGKKKINCLFFEELMTGGKIHRGVTHISYIISEYPILILIIDSLI